MCCDQANDFEFKAINGECPKCGCMTVDGVAYDQCQYSPLECDLCESSPCTGSC